ncbi:Hint domain-containing protein [Acetobacteraceae bacterium ESL0709]|nr:Hint domain-containing protein [Acetobacteraceae bacterium ESL0697]MDF7678940.1 Hint domain-containing protein [Acetobacteraceae bacterium ESL0709]
MADNDTTVTTIDTKATLVLSSGTNKNYTDSAGRKSASVTSGAYYSNATGTLYNVIASGYRVTSRNSDGSIAGTSASLLLTSDSNTVISGATALDGAAVAVSNSAHLYGGYAGSDASVNAIQGGIISGVEVMSGGAAAASELTSDTSGTRPLGGLDAGGTIYNPLVHSGGYILAGGGGPGFTIKGFNVAGSRGLISGGTIEDGAVMAVGKGGTSIGGTFAGTQYVQSTGKTFGNIFSGHHATQIVNGGLASASTALDGAQVLVSGGQGSNMVAGQGGTVSVTGGTYISVLTSDHSTSAGNYSTGRTYGNTVLSGGTEVVGSDGYATSSVVLSGGQDLIQSGGTALQTNVSGGTAEVASGGYMSAGSAGAGGTIAISGGGTGLSIVANSAGYVDIQSGASAANIIANSSGHVVADSGAFMSGATANSGGLFDVQSGATVVQGVHVNGGTASIDGQADVVNVSGGTAVVHSGGSIGAGYVSGGTRTSGGPVVQGTLQYDSGALVGDGGLSGHGYMSAGPGGVAILNGGTVNAVGAAGSLSTDKPGMAGTVILHGTTNSVSISDGGVLSAGSGAYIRSTSSFVVSGASAYIGPGAVVSLADNSSFVLNDVDVVGDTTHALTDSRYHSGYLNVAGGSVTFAGVSGGATMDVDGGFVMDANATRNGVINVNSGAMVNTVTITNDTKYGTYDKVASAGQLNINSDGRVGNVGVNSGGVVSLNSGGFAFGVVSAYNGGTALINSGGTISSLEVAGSAKGTIQAGATVNDLTVSAGGSVVFMSGASALAITVASGGWVSGPFVTDGNTLSVSSGGTVIGATITGGRSDAQANPGGGTDHPTVVDNSGDRGMVVASGATLISANVTGATSSGGAGGLLVVQSGAVLQHTSMGTNGRIKIEGLGYDDQHKSTFVSGGTLYITVGDGADKHYWSIGLDGSYKDSDFTLVDDGQGNTVLVYGCFLAGSLIRLENGEVPVEEIKEGDRICVLENGQKQIREVTSVIHRHARVRKDLPEELAGWPVQVCKDAFAPGVPSQDLFVTPEHSFYLEGRFVPVRMLVNGTSIRYDFSQDSYDYYHVQTEPHSVIWANNALTESYLETGVRKSFEAQGGDIARLVYLKDMTWHEDAAAPLEVSRTFVEPLYNNFRDRALALGYAQDGEPAKQALTEKSGLHLVLDDGTVVESSRETNGRMVFALPRKVKTVRLVSKTFRPSSTIGPFVDDRRELGVLVREVELWVGNKEMDVTSHLDRVNLPGWSVVEAGPHRWTMGDALLPLPDYTASEGEKILIAVQVEAGGPYPEAAPLGGEVLALSA